MPTTKERPKPIVLPAYCKGCGRCIEACPRDCITLGTEVNQTSGLTPVEIDYEVCNGCGLCISACPEPYGLATSVHELEDPRHLYGERETGLPQPVSVADVEIPLPEVQPLVVKGNHAAAIGALIAGCRHVFGYPITPSTEGAELMARLLPGMDGVFLQAVSETATVNHMYGCGGAGMPCMTFTSSPGFSLMLEGISYMVGAEVPAVFINVMRGGPGLGNIAPEQGDIKLCCRGLGHGNTHAIVLAPSTPQEMLDYTIDAFRLAFRYRNPVIVAADGYLGQMTSRVTLPRTMVRPGIPGWAVYGDAEHRGNLINSIYLAEAELEKRNQMLQEKYHRMIEEEQRAHRFRTERARVLVIACNTPARMARGAVERLRNKGLPVGLFQPGTLWPFPINDLLPLLEDATDLLVVEASAGQLEDEVRLALSHAGVPPVRIHNLRRMGGILPQENDILAKAESLVEETA